MTNFDQRECLDVFGNDYSTLDGTGIRDCIHVMDLAGDHAAVMKYFNENDGMLMS